MKHLERPQVQIGGKSIMLLRQIMLQILAAFCISGFALAQPSNTFIPTLETASGASRSKTITELGASQLPPERRESQIRIITQLENIPNATYYIISDLLPEGATYLPNSSRAVQNANPNNSTSSNSFQNQDQSNAIPEPIWRDRRAYWVIPAQMAQTNPQTGNSSNPWFGINYRVTHENPLSILSKPSVLVVTNSRNTGTRIDPNSELGKLLGTGEIRVLSGESAALEALQTRVAPVLSREPVASLELRVERAKNDPTDNATLLIRALDASGLPTNAAEFVTLEISPEPSLPDADPLTTGYQARLQNGEARVPLFLGGTENQPNPILEIRVEARLGTLSSSQKFMVAELGLSSSNPLAPDVFPVAASPRPLFVLGTASAQVNLDLNSFAFSASGGIRAFVRGELGSNWVLSAGINWQAAFDTTYVFSGNLQPPSNPFERFPLLGDASVGGTDSLSNEGIYARLENGTSYIMYGQISPRFTGLLTNYNPNFNGFAGAYRSQGIQIGAFAALVPNAKQQLRLPADGTGFYRLGNPVEASSERLVIAVYDKNNPSLKLEERQLKRLVDYTIDELTGNITLIRPLLRFTDNGNPQFLEVDYTIKGDNVPRDWRFGAQASLEVSSGLFVRATALQYQPDPQARYQFGVGVGYQNGGLQLALEGSSSNGALAIATQAALTAQNFQATLRYTDAQPDYIAPSTNIESQGRSLNARAIFGSAEALSLNLNLDHAQNYRSGTSSFGLGATLANDFGTVKAFAGVMFNTNNNPTQINPQSFNIYAALGADLELDAWTFGITQRVPLMSNSNAAYGDTAMRLEYKVNQNLRLTVSNRLSYEPNGIRQTLGIGATSTFSNRELLRFLGGAILENPLGFGSTNLAIGYELDTLSGTAGRARVGLDTQIPLTANWATDLSGEMIVSNSITGSLGLGLRLNNTDTQGSTRVQLSFDPNGIKQVYSLVLVAKTSQEFSISPSLEYTVLPNFVTVGTRNLRDGGRYSLALAWRSDDLAILSNHTGRFGISAPQNDFLQGEIQFGYHANENLFLRTGAAYRLELNPSLATLQFNAGSTWFLTREFGLGANANVLWQPSTSTSKFAFGVEASLLLTKGVLGTVGFNLIGFSGFTGTTNPGIYFRLDFIFDEGWFK